MDKDEITLEMTLNLKWEVIEDEYGFSIATKPPEPITVINARNEELAQHVVDLHNNSLVYND